jgi:anti-anti-sigma factor
MDGAHDEGEVAAPVVQAAGEIDAYSAPQLEAKLRDASGQPRIVIDLSRVSFLDSTAVGAVVRGLRELQENGSEVRIVLPAGPARRIFEITTLDRVLPISATRADALAELDAASP